MSTNDTPPWEDDTPSSSPASEPEQKTAQKTSSDPMEFFPFKTPRKSQISVIRAVDKMFQEGKKIVLLEAPVGSGKSPIAITLARHYKQAHILTPRKSLQDQYHDDFKEHLVLMKGRSSYPCIMDSQPRRIQFVLNAVTGGKTASVLPGEDSCNNGPCKGNKAIYQLCTKSHPCPYTMASKMAETSDIIVHNVHSFVFQTSYGEKFSERPLMVCDEAHDLEGILRDFATKEFTLQGIDIPQGLLPANDPEKWFHFLTEDKYVPEEEDEDELKNREARNAIKRSKDPDAPLEESPKAIYLKRVTELVAQLEESDGFVVEAQPVKNRSGQVTATTFRFIPMSIAGQAQRLIFNYGTRVLLMSGTVYDRADFCRNLGISQDQVGFLRISSSFPKANRPIYCKQDYMVNTSHATWDDNFPEMIEKIKKIMNIFKDAKGLIHAPSYYTARQIAEALKDPRVVTHEGSHDLVQQLDAFYSSKSPKVFISPVCQQGVDFKGDRGRFQIILRVPYANTSSPFMAHKVKNDFGWYNYQALVVFGQQLGRINRSEDDFGATFLMDTRFSQFISKNRKKIPAWVTDAIVY